MTKEELADAIRARCEGAAVSENLAREFIINAREDVRTLLGAIDEGDFKHDQCLAEMFLKDARIRDLEAECDQWKARAGALEMAVKPYRICDICVQRGIISEICDKCCITNNNWQFNEAGFGGGGGTK